METAKRNKEETKRKLIRATGEIFCEHGYAALGPTRICRLAGVSKPLLYRYFGDVQQLFKTYLAEQDYWTLHYNDMDAILKDNRQDNGQKLAASVLESQLDYFYQNQQMQRIIQWEITEKNAISRGISDTRERLGDQMLGLTDDYFKGSGVNFRVLLALLIAGIYYFVLHARVNGSTFCGIDINKEADMKEVHRTLRQVVGWAYRMASAKHGGQRM